MAPGALVAWLLLVAPPSLAAEVLDLRGGSLPSGALATSERVQLGGTLYFVRSTPGEGEELWAADLDGGGARLVVDLFPGSVSSHPRELVALGDRVFFSANDGRGPWVFETDGTARGTRRSTLFPSPTSTRASWLEDRGGPWLERLGALPGRLLVVLPEADGAGALYVSDGRSSARRLGAIPWGDRSARLEWAAEAGARVLAVDGTGALWSFEDGEATQLEPPDAWPRLHGVVSGRAVLSSWRSDPADLRSTDGTPDGSEPLAPGLAWSGGAMLDGRLLLLGRDALAWSLWQTDGTATGTRELRELAAAEPHLSLELEGLVGTRLLYRSSDGLLHSTEVGSGETEVVWRAFLEQDPLVVRDGFAYFQGWREVEPGLFTGLGLVRTDGTAAGTALLAKVGWSDIAVVPAGVVLEGFDPREHAQLRLVTDGEVRVIADFGPEPRGSGPDELGAAGGRVVFSAEDDEHGREPWSSDGTLAGTRLLADLRPGEGTSYPTRFERLADGVLRFCASAVGTYPCDPYATDGTPEGTRSLAADPPWAHGRDLLGDGASWYVARTAEAEVDRGVPPPRWELHRHEDGADTLVLGPIYEDFADGPVRVGDRVAFTLALRTAPYAFGRHDGALFAADAAGAELLAPLAKGLLTRGDLALFVAADRAGPLFVTDGTTGGTRPLGVEALLPLALSGDRFFFAGDDGTGFEPWTSDGTPAGTRRLAELSPGPGGSLARGLAGFAGARGGAVFFADAGDGPALFVATAAGVSRLADVRPDPETGAPRFTPLGDGLLAFAGWQPESGLEPWVTDGTAPGTRPVGDLAPGPASSSPRWPVALGDRLVLSAFAPTAGRELLVAPLPAFTDPSSPPLVTPAAEVAPLPPATPVTFEPIEVGLAAQGRSVEAPAATSGGCSSATGAEATALLLAGAALVSRARRRREAEPG